MSGKKFKPVIVYYFCATAIDFNSFFLDFFPAQVFKMKRKETGETSLIQSNIYRDSVLVKLQRSAKLGNNAG